MFVILFFREHKKYFIANALDKVVPMASYRLKNSRIFFFLS